MFTVTGSTKCKSEKNLKPVNLMMISRKNIWVPFT